MLLVVLVAVCAAAALLAWGVLLQDLVPQWADVRCLVGVLRVGTGSAGATGRLPALADATDVLLPLLLVAAGGAAAAHAAGRDRPEGPPRRAHLSALFVVGVLAIAAAASMTAWIAIPKAGKHLSSGCCTPAGMVLVEEAAPAGTGAGIGYAVSSAAFAAGLFFSRRGVAGSGVRLASAAGILLFGSRLLSDRVAPFVLGTPLHRCAWCLLGEAPETAWGMALLAAPLLATLWGLAARGLGPGSGPTLERIERVLDGVALLGLLGAPLFFAAERLAS